MSLCVREAAVKPELSLEPQVFSDLESSDEGRMLLYVGWDLADGGAQTLTIHPYLSRHAQVAQVTAGHAVEKDGLTGPTEERWKVTWANRLFVQHLVHTNNRIAYESSTLLDICEGDHRRRVVSLTKDQ